MSNFTASQGRVILGLHGDFKQAERVQDGVWNEDTRSRYMDQIRERAQLMASEILAQALAEADNIRQAAQREGLQDAQDIIDARLVQEKARVGTLLAGLESALKAEKERIFATHKRVLFDILRLAFEKTLGLVLETRREQVLTNLLTEAVEHVHATATITVHVSPEDHELAREQLARLKVSSTQLPEVVLKVDPAQTLGGVRLECGAGVVDNTISSRLEQVRVALDAAQDTP